MSKQPTFLSLALAACLVPAACGGGGGSGGNKPPGGNNPPSGENKPPVAVIAPIEGKVLELSTVTLSAAGSSDPDGDELTFAWKQVGGAPLSLAGANTAQASIEIPKVQSEAEYAFEVAVSDSRSTAKARIDITVHEGEGALYVVMTDRYELWRKHQADAEPLLLFATSPAVQDDLGEITDLQVSPDRRWLAFRSRQPGEQKRRLHVMSQDVREVYDVLGAMPNAASNVTSYSWLPDGSGLVFRADGRSDDRYELYFLPMSVQDPLSEIRAISGDLADFLDEEGKPGSDGQPDGGVTGFVLSPTGEHIAFRGRMRLPAEELFVSDLNGNRRRVSGDLRDGNQDGVPEGGVGPYFWSSSGRWLAFYEDHDADDNYEIYVLDTQAAESEAIKVSDDGARGDEQVVAHPSWSEIWFSPAEDKLIFSFDPIRRRLRLVSMASGLPERTIVADPIVSTGWTAASWSPDGRHFVFVASGFENVNGRRLYVVDVSESVGELRDLTGDVVAGGNVSHPEGYPVFQWSHDSRHVAFIGDLIEDQRFDLFATDVASEQGRRHIRTLRAPKCNFGKTGIMWSFTPGTLFLGGEQCFTSNDPDRLASVLIENPALSHLVDYGIYEVSSYIEKPDGSGHVFLANDLGNGRSGIYERSDDEGAVQAIAELDVSLTAFKTVVHFGRDGVNVLR